MEFEIDEAMVRAIVSHEYASACNDLAAKGPLFALARSQDRHEQRLATAGDAGTLACKAGCYWCCYFTVDVRAAEVFVILDFLESHLPSHEQQRLHEEIVANSAMLSKLDRDARTRRNVKCPFLTAGRCTIYSVRPQTCRNYHATNVAGCQQSFEEPDNLDIDPEFAPLVYQTGGAHVDAFSKAMRDAGYDTDAFELNSALSVALAQSGVARQRFESKQPPFVAADNIDSIDVPLEFIYDDSVA